MRRLPLLLSLLAFGLPAPPAAAQVGFGAYNGRNHPELDWRVAETAHFAIMYPAHLAGIEAEAAAVAEASYAALSENLGGVTFDRRIRIYLSDEDEVANGSAWDVGPAGFTTIWVHVNEAAEVWTGEAKWLRKVLAHEIAHLFHYRAVQSPIGLLQNLVAYPLPRWWTEGLAQYETERWDAERGDRWLRTAVFEDRLSAEDGASAWNGRLLYAAGNSQVRYLADTYGDSTLVRILRHRKRILGLVPVHDFAAAFEAVMDRPYAAFQEEWRKHVNVYYNTLAGQMERVDSLGAEPLALPGQYVYDVAYSPDTTQIAAVVLSSLVRPVRRLFVMNNTAGDSTRVRNVRVLAEGALEGPVAWSPAGDRLAYARTVRGRHGSLLNDLYLVDTRAGRKERLTESRRAISPTFAPDGRRLAFVGSAGGTANVFMLDLETGAETALTRFEGDVQITSARWAPEGERVAFALFDADGTRTLMTVDAATGALTPLPTGGPLPPEANDSRLPVWRPDGGALAFVSRRDDVPNVFTVGAGEGDSLGLRSPPTVYSLQPTEQRLTYLYAGATVHDWLPPDSLHPAGRLVLVASETKRRDRVFVVDAARGLTVEAAAPPAVPPGYASWTDHRPPREVPFAVAPDSALVTGRHGYRSLANLTHAITLPLPYADPANDDYGAFANSIWLEPLGKHQLFVLAGVSVTRFVDKSFLLLSYTNNTLAPSLTLGLYRFPSPTSFYGTGLLVEDLTGGDLSATLPLDLTDAPFTVTLAGARVRYAYASPFDLDADVDLSASGGDLPQPEAGFRADLQLGFAWKRQRPYRYNALAPLDGAGLRARVTLGAPVLGSDNAFARPDVAAYAVLPAFGFGQFYLYGRGTAVFGRPLAQDFVGLARYDDVDVQLPVLGAVTLDDAERVRGYRRYAVGDRVLFGTAEWRLPAVFDLDTRLLGLVDLDRVGLNLFADGGVVWTGAAFGDAVRRTGVGAEAANLVRLGDFQIRHALGVAVPWGALGADLVWDDVDLYYRLQAAVPF